MTNFTGADDVDRCIALVVWNPDATDSAVKNHNPVHRYVVESLAAAPCHRISAAALARELEARWNDTRELAERRKAMPAAWDLSPGVDVGWAWLLNLLAVEGLGLALQLPATGRDAA